MQKCYFFQISMKASKNDSGFMRVAKRILHKILSLLNLKLIP